MAEPTTENPDAAQTETSTDQPEEPVNAFDAVPEHNETVSTEITDDSYDDKRRVKETYYRVISDGEHITYIHDGDTLVRAHENGLVTDEIKAIGPNISSTDGMHVVLEKESPSPHMNPIHLNLIRKWIDNGDAVIYGKRQSRYSEVKGVDY